MVKKILISSLCSAMILLSGCGDSEGEERLSIQQMLDDGNYVGVISALESSADSDDDYMALGAAYMGKAGLSLANIVTAVASESDSGGSGFALFVESIAEQSTLTALVDLGKSASFYKEVVGNACTTPSLNLSDSQKDICLFIGLGATTKAAVAIDSLIGDISTFGDGVGSDDKLTASACAMQYAFNGSTGVGCSIVENTDVNFTTINKVYKELTVTVNFTGYDYLMNSTTPKQTVLTDGYCTNTDFSTRVDTYDSTTAPYACPVNEDPLAEELTTAGVLVDILNEGIDSIGAAVTEDIQADINEFREEITGSVSGTVTEQNIIDYLNDQN